MYVFNGFYRRLHFSQVRTISQRFLWIASISKRYLEFCLRISSKKMDMELKWINHWNDARKYGSKMNGSAWCVTSSKLCCKLRGIAFITLSTTFLPMQRCSSPSLVLWGTCFTLGLMVHIVLELDKHRPVLACITGFFRDRGLHFSVINIINVIYPGTSISFLFF